MKDAPCLSGFTACKPAEPPTGGRPQRPGKASSVGAWTGLLQGCAIFHALRVACSAMDNGYFAQASGIGCLQERVARTRVQA